MSKSIVFLVRLWPCFGGGETVTITLANEFVRRGYAVHILYFKITNNKNLQPVDSRISTVLVKGVDCDEFHSNEEDSNKAQTFLINYINKNTIDFVINQWWPVSYIKDVKRLTTAKMIKCNHTALSYHQISYKGVVGLIKKLFKDYFIKRLHKSELFVVEEFLPYVDKYVFLSDRFVTQYEQIGGDNKEGKICAIPNPLSSEIHFCGTELEEKENIVLFVGRIVDSLKRLSISLNTWKTVESKDDLKKWTLIVVGDGPDLTWLKDLSNKLGLKRVEFVGFQNPSPYYKRSKLLVQNSKFEGFGMTIIEAQQQACVPVAMNTFLTVHDLIKNGENGIITEDNPQDFSERLIEIMRDENRRNKMAINALRTSEEFKVYNVVDKWEFLFNKISIE